MQATYQTFMVCAVIFLDSGSSAPDSSKISVIVANTTQKLEVVQVSASAGYIQTPGWSYLSLHPREMDSLVWVKVPKLQKAMVTIVHLHLAGSRYSCDQSKVNLVLYRTATTQDTVLWRCGPKAPPARKQVHGASTLRVHFKSWESPKSGFKMFFSIHNKSAFSYPLTDTTWNCSVAYFRNIKPHFPCDLVPQCLNMEDERDCQYFSEQCGLGFITMGTHCVFYINKLRSVTWMDVELRCSRRGGVLMNLRSPDDYDRLLRYLQPLIDVWGFYKIVVGLHSTSPSLPIMYRNELQHTDKTIAYYRLTRKQYNVDASCGSVIFLPEGRNTLQYVTLGYCTAKMNMIKALCEIPKNTSTSARSIYPVTALKLRSGSNPNSSHPPILHCPLGHVTRDFLACDFVSTCWSRDMKSCLAPLTPLPPSFSCSNGFEGVPYMLVCDVRPDCSDGSDESFCEFPPCDLPEPFYCSDHECVPHSAVCNGQKNCYNGVDEQLCSIREIGFKFRPPPPAIIYLNQTGHFNVHKLNLTKDVSSQTCPETHFQCPDNGYCMPVFLRCNGVYDCLGREDETGCHSYTCPGFYRCRGSVVCLHPEHLCDGIVQCPQDDDELLCGYDCPGKCVCYGLAFCCRQTFEARNFTKLRFLDVHGSGMKISDLRENVLLVYLNLAANGLSNVNELNFPNLRILDLSDNQLENISFLDLNQVPQLEHLSLSGNPLLSLYHPVHRSVGVGNDVTTASPEDNGVESQLSGVSLGRSDVPSTIQFKLNTLDLSRVKIGVLDPMIFTLLPNLHTINMSGCGVDTLLGDGFQALTQLRALDLRGCPLTYFPRTIFRGLENLETVRSDNFKLCCPATLPTGFVLKKCSAPYDEISSCEALLRSNSYRVFLSIFATLAILGNSSSFVFRLLKQRNRKLSFDVFVTYLCVADFLMGVYLSVIGVADRLYQGTYLWEDEAWKQGGPCRVVGFLSLVSSEVSALIICLITIDRFLVLRFPFSIFHFGARSAQVASLCVWTMGCLIAAVPLLPWVDHWQFYSQTGICIPLPISRRDSPGYTYAFGVMIVTNFVFFVAIAAGQCFVYWSIRASSLSVGETSRKSQDIAIARRLTTVAMSDFLCWFPIGVVGIMAATGTPISSEINVAMAICVLPFNSALNPFIYTLNIVMERRRRAHQEMIRERLMAKFKAMSTEEKKT